MALTLADAVSIAGKRLREVFPEATDFRLEEVERQMNDWLITLSFPERGNGTVGQILGRREYKTVQIDGASGEVQAIRMRVLHE